MRRSTIYAEILVAQDQQGFDAVVKRWDTPSGNIIAANKKNTLHFFVEKRSQLIPLPLHYVEGLPKVALDLTAWKIFLANTAAKLTHLQEQEYKLYIAPRLCGGGHIVSDMDKIWPTCTIPYEIDVEAYDPHSSARNRIIEAIQIWNKANVGFQFVPRSTEKDFLFFSRPTEQGAIDVSINDVHWGQLKEKKSCNEKDKEGKASAQLIDEFIRIDNQDKSESLEDGFVLLAKSDAEIPCPYAVGYQVGKQSIDCLALDTSRILHLLGHAVGLLDEHERVDRKAHVCFKSALSEEDNALNPSLIDSFIEAPYKPEYPSLVIDARYDFASIMHRRVNTLLPEGFIIRPRSTFPMDGEQKIGRATALSLGDRAAIKELAARAQKKVPQQKPAAEAMRLSVESEFCDQPQWQILRNKGREYEENNDFQHATLYYTQLLTEYQSLINGPWKKYPLMMQMIEQCQRCCAHYADSQGDHAQASTYHYLATTSFIRTQFALSTLSQNSDNKMDESRLKRTELSPVHHAAATL